MTDPRARVQDDVRLQARSKTAGQTELLLEGGSKESKLVAALRSRYQLRARRKVVEMLIASGGKPGVAYVDLYCEAMAFPLVTPNDLCRWLRELEPAITMHLTGI